MNWQPRLRTVLLIINIGIILLPLGGIGVLRLYEGELIRRTETELIAQGVLIAAAYRQELARASSSLHAGHPATKAIHNYGLPVTMPLNKNADSSRKYNPITPRLGISGEHILPPPPVAATPAAPADPLALEAAKAINPLLQASKELTLVGIRVLDYRGTVVASTGGEIGLSMFNRQEVTRSLAGEYTSLLRRRVSDEPPPALVSISRGTLKRVFVGMPVVNGNRVEGVVLLSRTPLDIRKAFYNERDQLLLAAAVLFGVVLLVTLLTSLMINRPLKALVRQAERIVRGERSLALPPQPAGIHEIEQLSRSVAAMAESLEDRADYIRTFAANVSHEFKTPLAAIRGAVEIIGDHIQEMTSEERQRFLKLIADDTERLDRLVRRLLDLARADTSGPGNEQTAAAETLARLAERYRNDNIRIDIAGVEALPPVHMAPEAFESIITNLVENSRQHGGDDVAIRVSVEQVAASEGKYLQMDFRDNGPGIPAGNREKVFRPFFTTARDKGGSGLGLSIVRSLLAAHGGTISLEPGDEGAWFRVLLPM
jgi:signal transduction histidine kinase